MFFEGGRKRLRLAIATMILVRRSDSRVIQNGVSITAQEILQ
jgi:hypothetical protein